MNAARLRVLLREPLVHFVAFGLLVFALGRWLSPDPRLIRIRAYDVEASLAEALGRAPTPEERSSAVEARVREEMLAREARARGLDRADPVVRSYLARKMSHLLDASDAPPVPSDAELRDFYESARADFTVDERVTLRHLFVSGLDEGARARAEALRARVEGGEDPRALADQSDRPPFGPVLRGRAPDRLETLLGEAFAAWARSAPPGTWAVVESKRGWHVAKILKRRGGRTLTFEEARDRVVLRWQAARLREASDAAVEAIRGRYRVELW